MASSGVRKRVLKVKIENTRPYYEDGTPTGSTSSIVGEGTQLTESESHRFNRDKRCYDAGGPFYTSRVQPFFKTAHVHDCPISKGSGKHVLYTGPVLGRDATGAEYEKAGYKGVVGSFDKTAVSNLGGQAVSLCNPVNSASDLGTGLAEIFREGAPSLPGIQSWQKRANLAKSAGSEYLNYIFGWAPLVKEVHDVAKAARTHRDIMNQYHGGEGKDTHRTFNYPLDSSSSSFDIAPAFPDSLSLSGVSFNGTLGAPKRTVSRVKETKAWFEGCFTYALPSSTDSWRKHIGIGTMADQVFGLALTPDILWELAPWSWAVDWFTNAGEVINNVTNFGLAGLVMRYGYMMVETTDTVTVSTESCNVYRRIKAKEYDTVSCGATSRGVSIITKRRMPANPFGFSIGWEGLSPTQLAITAALGITKFL
ncbi:maturation protein [ssRNA phage Gerhypos.4_55]|uniref:Maturation protein n=2 Tax=Leviviricetes TaxID=2842243 RepID=A0A8S5L2Y9_9VIRU|nr:maturation protein [ssRNA phage Gerhypos.4_55]QDH86841.1 MAG: hypothetical protein H4Bulk47303_000003 [Leviviridae sp.]DAD51867.1 TPA_asm: maturation protein [ssRNA phage Gerhypos.4_55]